MRKIQMNERIKELVGQAGGIQYDEDGNELTAILVGKDLTKFALLIVRECKENFSKVWYDQGMDIRGAEIGKFLTRFDEHFGVEE
jgi:hypothetical protein